MQKNEATACAGFEDKWLEFLAESGFDFDDVALKSDKPQRDSVFAFKVVTVRRTYLWLFAAALATWAIQ